MAASAEQIPRGLHHLVNTAKNKFVAKYPSRAPHPTSAWVAPKDRIKRWNVVPGDKVRLMTGKPEEKYNALTPESGSKIYTVVSVDMPRNRLYLDGLTNTKANPIQPLPEDYESLPEDEQQSYREQRNFVAQRRPVHYSNVQLCVYENGKDSIFATRVATGAPFFDRQTRRMRWKRFAAAVSVLEHGLPTHGERGQVLIPWPKMETPKKPEATAVDTVERTAAQETLNLGAPETIPLPLIPQSMRGPAPGPEDQDWADEYVFKPASRSTAELEAALPLYIAEELSPRYSRAKRTKGWNLRREAEEEAKKAYVQQAVEDWEAGGRDRGLQELFALDAVQLEGVSLRPRTRAEIREAAARDFDTQILHQKKLTRRAAAAGMRFMNGEWVDGARGLEVQRKRSRKARKLRKIEERLEKLSLEDKPNQVVPPSAA